MRPRASEGWFFSFPGDFSHLCHVAGLQTRDQAGASPQGCGAVCGGPPGGVRRLQDQTGEENPALHPELVHPPRDRGGHCQTPSEIDGTEPTEECPCVRLFNNIYCLGKPSKKKKRSKIY